MHSPSLRHRTYSQFTSSSRKDGLHCSGRKSASKWVSCKITRQMYLVPSTMLTTISEEMKGKQKKQPWSRLEPVSKSKWFLPLSFHYTYSVLLRFHQELFHSPSNRSREQELAGDRIVEFDGCFLLAQSLQEIGGLPVASKFGVVPESKDGNESSQFLFWAYSLPYKEKSNSNIDIKFLFTYLLKLL